MRMRHSLLLAVTLVVGPLSATTATAETAAETKKAKELFSAAQKLYKQGRFADAIQKFEQANAAKPHPVIHYNIGRCYEELDKVGLALKAYKTYLRLAPEAKDRDQVADTIAALERRLRDQGLQQLTVVVEPAGATIEVDGKPAGPSPATVELTRGEHRVTVVLEGYETLVRTISMTPGQASELNLTLVRPSELKAPPPPDAPLVTATPAEPLTTPNLGVGTDITDVSAGVPPPAPARKRVWTYVVGGFAVASLGAAVGMGLAANAEAATYRAGDPANQIPNPETGALMNGPWADAKARRERVDALSTGSTVSYGVAGAAAITAVVLFFVGR